MVEVVSHSFWPPCTSTLSLSLVGRGKTWYVCGVGMQPAYTDRFIKICKMKQHSRPLMIKFVMIRAKKGILLSLSLFVLLEPKNAPRGRGKFLEKSDNCNLRLTL